VSADGRWPPGQLKAAACRKEGSNQNSGLVSRSRAAARGKMEALASGAAILRRELGA
jgi:hypothetical protein